MAYYTSGEPAGRQGSERSDCFIHFTGRDSAKSELWDVAVIPLRTNSMYPFQAPGRSVGPPVSGED
ncbi:hypothetical protein B7T07_20865 [Cronobacter sakazakii]|uniref:Uncharacterized protein n=1 Tax=Cronobacter sakazakii TaxID=28141 RepID=A0AA44Z6F5_CROSK|nr:hypothetical protein B7T07_20865 [Cronobacter sakazakii]